MRAIVQRRYGRIEDLELGEVARPVPAEGEVLVRVVATSVHADVWHVVTGLPYVMRLMGAGLTKPRNPIPGTDLAGVVEELGPSVTGLSVGDEVYGEVVRGHQWKNGGTFAEFCVVHAEALGQKPSNLSFEEAAAMATPALIALWNLRDVAKVQAGQHVLINGAGGALGLFAIQLAKAFGATVTAVDNADKQDLLRTVGADHTIDYRQQDPTTGELRYDAIIDIASNLGLTAAKRVLTETGLYVLIGHHHYDEDSHRVLGALGTFIATAAKGAFDPHLPGLSDDMGSPDDMKLLTELAENGKLRPVIYRVFPLEEAVAALQYLKEGAAKGRIVLSVGG